MQSISTGFTLTVTRQWTAPWKRCCYLKTSQIHWDIHCFSNAGVHGVSYGVRHGVSHGVRYGVGHELGKGSVMGSVIGLVMGMVRRSQYQKSLLWHHHSLTTRVRYRAARAASDTNVYWSNQKPQTSTKWIRMTSDIRETGGSAWTTCSNLVQARNVSLHIIKIYLLSMYVVFKRRNQDNVLYMLQYYLYLKCVIV